MTVRRHKRQWFAVCAAVAALLVSTSVAVGSDGIVGGTPASPGEYPAQGFLDIGGTGFCGSKCYERMIAVQQRCLDLPESCFRFLPTRPPLDGSTT